MKYFAALSLVILCTSCASTQPSPWQEIPLPSKQFVVKGFSLVLPNETGWWVNTRLGPDRLSLVKSNHASDPYENYSIQAWVLNVRAFKSNGEFLQAVKEGMPMNKEPRYKILKHDINPHEKNGEHCALAQVVAEDHGKIPNFGFGTHRKPGYMILEGIELTCRHPRNNSVAINMFFSLTYYPGERDSSLTERAMKVVDNVTFADL